MTEMEIHAKTDLTIRDDQTYWDDKQRAALVQLGVKDASDADLAVFYHQVVRTGLDPFARQIYMIERQGKQTIQTGIDGFRLIARRATDRTRGTLGYEPTEWCGPDGRWVDVWLSSTPPAAARVTVIRNGSSFPAVALFSEYAGHKRDGGLMTMWANKGALMLAKCAEALALRKAFPQDLSGVYTDDETQHQTAPAVQAGAPAPGRAGVAAAIQHTIDPDAPVTIQGTVDEPTGDPHSHTAITTGQLRLLHKYVNDLGLDRDTKLAGCGRVTGRTITTTNELTTGEAARVIDALKARLDGDPPTPDPATDPPVGEAVAADLLGATELPNP